MELLESSSSNSVIRRTAPGRRVALRTSVASSGGLAHKCGLSLERGPPSGRNLQIKRMPRIPQLGGVATRLRHSFPNCLC